VDRRVSNISKVCHCMSKGEVETRENRCSVQTFTQRITKLSEGTKTVWLPRNRETVNSELVPRCPLRITDREVSRISGASL
jgi:hypothetical protein